MPRVELQVEKGVWENVGEVRVWTETQGSALSQILLLCSPCFVLLH